jgi:hypothetical protein
MQKRHFEMIAAIVREIGDYAVRAVVADNFARRLASTNSRFDRARFLTACGISAE